MSLKEKEIVRQVGESGCTLTTTTKYGVVTFKKVNNKFMAFDKDEFGNSISIFPPANMPIVEGSPYFIDDCEEKELRKERKVLVYPKVCKQVLDRGTDNLMKTGVTPEMLAFECKSEEEFLQNTAKILLAKAKENAFYKKMAFVNNLTVPSMVAIFKKEGYADSLVKIFANCKTGKFLEERKYFVEVQVDAEKKSKKPFDWIFYNSLDKSK